MEINEKNCPRTFAAINANKHEFVKNGEDFVPASLCAKLEQRLMWYKQKFEDMQKNDSHDDNRPPAYCD